MRARAGTWWALYAALCGCTQRSSHSCSPDATVWDGGCALPRDTGIDAPPWHPDRPDVPRPRPPWADGGWRLPWQAVDRPLPAPCGPGEPQGAYDHTTASWGLCEQPGWTMRASNGVATLLEPGGRLSFVRNHQPTVRLATACHWVHAVDGLSRETAVFYFEHPRAEGELLWRYQLAQPSEPTYALSGGVGNLVGTDQLVAFLLYRTEGGGGGSLWIGGPRGVGLRQQDAFHGELRGRYIDEMQADGNHLVMQAGGDIYLYTRAPDGSGAFENLTQDSHGQWSPWVSGRYVVWIDQRDEPRGSILAPNNSEVYLYDIETRTRRRITHDPPERPVVQLQSMVRGDWIVWIDYRNAESPNPTPVEIQRNPAQIYGYHIPTGREVSLTPVLPPRAFMAEPMLTEGGLWYVCAFRTENSWESGSYRMQLPLMRP